MLRFKKADGSEYPSWERKRINSFAKCVAGATPSTKVAEYWDYPTIRWMSSGEVHKGEIFDTDKKISQIGYDNTSTKMIRENTVVMALAGQGKTRGTVAITRVPLCTNQSICAIETDNTVLDDYLYQYLKTQYVQLRQLSSGEGQRGGLNLKLVGNYEVPLPCLEEQQKIADCLSSVDAVISDYEAQVENMQNQKKGVMQKLFSQEVRFKADDGSEYPDWEFRTFADVGSVSMCKRIFKEQTSDEGEVPFYKIGTFGGKPDAYISKELFSEFREKYSYPEKGAILLSASGTLGRTVKFDGKDAYFQDSNIIWLEHDDTVLDSFLEYLYKVVHWQEPEGGTIKRLYNKNFLETEFELPCLEEQQKIADCLSAFDDAIEDLQKTVEHWKNIKKGLLQQLFA